MGDDASIDFQVTHSRAALAEVTVRYATRDGTVGWVRTEAQRPATTACASAAPDSHHPHPHRALTGPFARTATTRPWAAGSSGSTYAKSPAGASVAGVLDSRTTPVRAIGNQWAHHVARTSTPSVCSGAAAALSLRIALRPNDRSGMPAASGVVFGLKATRRESDAAAPEHTLGFEIRATW